jgi:hypothetical protein
MRNIFKFAYVIFAIVAMAVRCSTNAFAAACAAGQAACMNTCTSYCTISGQLVAPGYCSVCQKGCQAGGNACNAACPVTAKPGA